jgi:hypothetical protein
MKSRDKRLHKKGEERVSPFFIENHQQNTEDKANLLTESTVFDI